MVLPLPFILLDDTLAGLDAGRTVTLPHPFSFRLYVCVCVCMLFISTINRSREFRIDMASPCREGK